jgi:hypothetical protein
VYNEDKEEDEDSIKVTFKNLFNGANAADPVETIGPLTLTNGQRFDTLESSPFGGSYPDSFSLVVEGDANNPKVEIISVVITYDC